MQRKTIEMFCFFLPFGSNGRNAENAPMNKNADFGVIEPLRNGSCV